MRLTLALAAGVLWTLSAGAAELPQRATKPHSPESKAKTCELGGERGYVTAGGGCIRIGGYVSGAISIGSLKH